MADDLWFELGDRQTLITFMRARDLSCRGLARKITMGGHPVSYQMIGHLRSGHERCCGPALAVAIEKALDVPPNILFYPRTQRRTVAA